MGYIEEIRKKVGNMPLILNSAGVIVKDSAANILLVFRKDTRNWGLPGGYMELGEAFEQTAKRELQEELQIRTTQLSLLHIFSGEEFYHEYPNGDKVYSIIAVYTTDEYEGNVQVDHSEVEHTKFFPLDDLPEQLTMTTKKILEYFGQCSLG